MRGDYFFLNNTFLPADQFDEELECGTVVYEVLRIMDGVPLFFGDHYQRLENSCRLIEENIDIEVGELFQSLLSLAQKNGITDGNVMLRFIFNNNKHNVLHYFIPHSYPSGKDYENGVMVGFLNAERNNPEAKIEQGIKELANGILKDSGLYEVFLVDREGFVTEGSRSNFFLIKENKLYSTPLNRVLRGITLAKVLDLAKHYKNEVVFDLISREEFGDYESAFITGTSPKILPVAQVGDYKFNVDHPILRRIMKHYNEMIVADIALNKE
jgi:branched-chain amino acid aminotransferase